MAFNPNDIYTSSGSAKLYNSWTPTVAKFDTSSFYNWEQDNLPIYDLDERTYELWEYNGFTTSSVPGFALTVSANAPAATLLANRNVFTSVSAAIAALPRVIRFPVLIEVCNFGDMGKLELHDFQIMENGSIEIINRNYSTVYDDNIAFGVSSTIDSLTVGTVYSRYFVRDILSSDVSATLGIGASSTKAVNLNSFVTSSAGIDSRFTNNVNSVFYPSVGLKKGPLSTARNRTMTSPGANKFRLTVYEGSIGTSTDTSLALYDFSSTKQIDSNSFLSRTSLATNDSLVGAIYGNNFKQISVKNCSGKIYIRNFCVLGDTLNFNGLDNGIEVINSDVVLENCTAINSIVNGFYFANSKVILSRSAYSYRNYKLDSASVRSSNQSCGFRAVNSEVVLSSLPGGSSNSARDYQTSGSNAVFCSSRNRIGFLLDNSILTGGLSRVTASDKNRSSLALELNNDFGLRAINSQIKLKGLIDIYENNVGAELLNSVMLVDELCCDRQGTIGISAKNSTIVSNESLLSLANTIDSDVRAQADFELNGQHLNLDNSTFKFKRATDNPSTHGGMRFINNHGLASLDGTDKFSLPSIRLTNNSKIDLINSQNTVTASYCDEYTWSYGRLLSLDGNSTASLYGTSAHCTVVRGPEGFNYQKNLAAICAKNGSVINLHGPTVISQAGIDVLVENSSTLNVNPPIEEKSGLFDINGFNLAATGNHTAVELHSSRACLVANNNSTINMEHLGDRGSTWANGTYGQIANANQEYDQNTGQINTYIYAGKMHFYPNPPNVGIGTGIFSDGMGTPGTSPTFTFDVTTQTLGYITGTPSYGGMCVRALGNSTVNAHNVNFGPGPNTGPLDGLYYDASGSTCNHLMIWNIADTSKLRASMLSVSSQYGADSNYYGPPSVYVSSNTYATNATGTNVAYGAPSATPDTGNLSVLDSFGAGGSSVSAAWKPASGTTINSIFNYFFPVNLLTASGLSAIDVRLNQSILASALTNNAGIALSGITVTGIQYGTSSNTHYKNNGMFRIYFSPDPTCKFLQHDVSGYAYGAKFFNTSGHPGAFSGNGIIHQIFAQGYNLSAPVSALNTYGDVSAYHPNLLKLSRDSNADGVIDAMHPSGFYYCKEFLQDNPTQVVIDESAAYVFANARNASLGSSGRPKRVSIYRAGSNLATGETNDGDTVGYVSTNAFDLKKDN